MGEDEKEEEGRQAANEKEEEGEKMTKEGRRKSD